MATTIELTEEQASFAARHLLRSENIGTLATNYHNASSDHVSLPFDISTKGNKEIKNKLEGPESWPYCIWDYYVDLPETKGDPIFFMSTIQNSVTNIKHDQRACFTVRNNAPYTPYSGHKPTPMTCGRIALIGKVNEIDPKVDSELVAAARSAFVTCHPEIGDGINFKDFHFYRLRVEKIYWVGVFGNLHYIGWIHDNLYIQVHESSLPSQKIGHDSFQVTQTCHITNNLVTTNPATLIKSFYSNFFHDFYSSRNSLAFRFVIMLLAFFVILCIILAIAMKNLEDDCRYLSEKYKQFHCPNNENSFS